MTLYREKVTKIPVDKNVVMPAKRVTGAGRPQIYPWKEMKIGDSFAWPDKNKKPHTACVLAGKRGGTVFRARVMDDGEYRIWRVA